jgi:Tfp pilus assembly protein PilF
MSLHDEAVPTHPHIRRQLERMLASPVFLEADTQARLLEHLVEKALAGEEVTEKTITAELFPVYQGRESGIVRVHKNSLRDRIEEYYEEHGGDSLVLITLPALLRKQGYKPPPGEAYKPSFKYNPLHPVDQDFRRGMYYLAQCAPSDDNLALDYFAAALKREPNHAAAHTGMAEVHLRRAMYYHVYVTPAMSLMQAQQSIDQALRCDAVTWRANAVQGILHCYYRRWEKARVSFDLAIKDNETQTRYGARYYPAFLMARGESADALHLASERARENPEDLPSQIMHGIFLYLARRFDDAVFALALAETMSVRHWLTHTTSALLALARNEPAAAHIILVHQAIGDDLFPGLLALCLSETLRLRNTHGEWGLSRREAIGTLFEQIYGALDELTDKLPSPEAQRDQLIAASKEKYIPPFQLALAHMAAGDSRQALASLTDAASEPYPLMAWLTILPIFDSLRKEPAFKKLSALVDRPPATPRKPPTA